MPVYEYKCSVGHITEEWRPVDLRSDPAVCDTCGGLAAKAILSAPRVFGDFEGYVSPVSGKWIEGKRARNEDLKATGSRHYEGFESELRAAEAQTKAYNAACEAEIDEAVDRTLGEMLSN